MRRIYPTGIVILVALLTTTCPGSHAQAPSAKVLQFNLVDYGWQSLPEAQPREWVGTRSRGVAIDREGRLLVGFTTREKQSLATRETPGLSFIILRLTPEGKVDLSLTLPTDNWFNNGFYLGPDDRIYARANNVFQILLKEPDGSSAAPIWKTLLSCSMECRISQSPSRRTLIVREPQAHQQWGPYTFTVLDVSSSVPQLAQSCAWIASDAHTITDKFAYQSSDGIDVDARRWPLCDRGHDTELPLDMRKAMIAPLSDQAFVLLGTGKERSGVELVAANGKTKFRHEMPKHDMVPSQTIRSDESGDRFAFTVENWRGGSRALDISGKRVARRVVAFSESGQPLAAVAVNPIYDSLRYQRDFDFSLSPDGHVSPCWTKEC